MSLGTWYRSLFQQAVPAVKQFGSGALVGAGIPRNLQEAKDIFSGFGEMLAGPTPEEMAQGPAPLIAAAKAAPAAVGKNPAFAAGVLGGMFAGGIDPTDTPKLAKAFLKRAAARRKNPGDIADELTLLHEGAPGRARRLEPAKVAKGTESAGDYAAMVQSFEKSPISTTFLVQHAAEIEKAVGNAPHVQAMREAARRRGWRGDISDFEHVAQEGPPGPIKGSGDLPDAQQRELRTLEDILQYGHTQAQEAYAKKRIAQLRGNDVWTREERGAALLEQAKLKHPPQTQLQAITENLNQQEAFKSLPVGTTIMQEGHKLVKTTKGWTAMGGKVTQRDFEPLLKQHFDVTIKAEPGMEFMPDIVDSRPEAAVTEIKYHGGWGDLQSDVEARRVVARHIRKRMAAGKAGTNEVVWLNIHDMRMQSPGKVRFKR